MTNLAKPDTTTGPASTAVSPGRIPGQPDIWVFVLFETLIFTAYFSVYLFSRTQHAAQFLHDQADLSLGVGIFNTLIMLTSSYTLAKCVRAARAEQYRAATGFAYVTLALGAVFLAAKIIEWSRELHIGNGLTTSEFFTHYFFLTGIHAVHVLIGFFALGIAIYQLRNPQRRCQQIIETSATYWHTVDFLWVLIFALIYVVR